jgi:hypothetical protein
MRLSRVLRAGISRTSLSHIRMCKFACLIWSVHTTGCHDVEESGGLCSYITLHSMAFGIFRFKGLPR